MNADTGARPSKIKWLVVGCLLAAAGYVLFQTRRQVVPAITAEVANRKREQDNDKGVGQSNGRGQRQLGTR